MGWIRLHNQNASIALSVLFGLLISFISNSYFRSGCTEILGEPVAGPSQDLVLDRFALVPKSGTQRNLTRPRYYSTELGIRDRLFVAVLTTESSIRTNAVALNRTSSHLVDKMMFFMDAKGAEKAKVVELKLPGIVGFVDTREILRPFHMLKYLTDNFLEEFDFFFIVKDTSYVNGRLLAEFVRKISVSEQVHAGAAKATDDSPYCTIGAGLLLSNSVLKQVQNSLDWCVKNAFSDYDDDNVGRCILHASQLPCSHTVNGNALESMKIDTGNIKDITSVHLKPILTYYPIMNDRIVYKLHLHLTKKRLDKLKSDLLKLETNLDLTDLSWPPGAYSPKSPDTRFDLIPWQYFDSTHVYLTSDFVNVQPLAGSDLIDATNIINRTVSWLSSRYPGELTYRRLVNGYRRFDPSRGLDYILDLAFRGGSGRQVIKRVEVTKPLGSVEMLRMPYVTENTRVHLLLPLLVGEKTEGMNFMTKYSNNCSPTEMSLLIIILLYEPNAPGKGHTADVFKEVKDLALSLSSKHNKICKITWISIRVPAIDGFAPLSDQLTYFAMTDLVSKKLQGESLVLFTEPGVYLRPDYLNRVRMGTIQNKQVYAPIPFTEYDPVLVYKNVSLRKTTLEIHKNTGRFDVENTRHLSFYLNDYIAANIFQREDIERCRRECWETEQPPKQPQTDE